MIELPHLLLAHLNSQMIREFRSFISKEKWLLFLKKNKEARQEELLDLAYYTC